LGLALAGCSFDAFGSGGAPSDPAPSGSSSSDTGNAVDSSTTTTPTSATSGGSDTTTGGTPSDDDSSGQTPTTADAGTEDPDPIGCPEPLPEGWILCEDFEDIADPTAHFATWEGAGLGLEGPGRDSPTALQITHQADEHWSGFVQIRFGEGPPATEVAQPNARFEEVWVRFHTRVAAGWPIMGPGDVLSVGGVSKDPAGATTFLARVTANQYSPQLFSSAYSCIFWDQHPCTSDQDWGTFALRGTGVGTEPVFGDLAESWTCVVLHARVNTPGQSNGVLDVLIEETLDS